MILSVTFSKPVRTAAQELGNDYIRVKIKLITASSSVSAEKPLYFAEFYTQKQVFHKKMTESELSAFIEKCAGKIFRSCVQRTDTEEITVLANKKGRVTRLSRPLSASSDKTKADSFSGDGNVNVKSLSSMERLSAPPQCKPEDFSYNRKKNYILKEGIPVPFLVCLGIMTDSGKVIASKYDKFRQINRFLEYIDDMTEELVKTAGTKDRPLRIVDFGCGKSYLTFAVHYFFTEIRRVHCDVTGLDLKEDVIASCSALAEKIGSRNLHFLTGDIASYGDRNTPDLVITLHACDTATDYALSYAVKSGVKAILSVPCCQHEINAELSKAKSESDEIFAPLLKYGIIKERFSALVTDALRAEYLENAGYKVQVMEFIDMSHTPKNILIRAVYKGRVSGTALTEADRLTDALGVSQTLRKLLSD